MTYSKKRLICGWGVNDVEYNVIKSSSSDNGRKQVWSCPYYNDWREMIRRCFDKNIYATYKDSTVCEEWRYLSKFREWVDIQPNKDWENCELDKDLLIKGNKHYSPETCVYISKSLNSFILDSGKARGNHLIGASRSGRENKPFQAGCSNPFTNKREGLGRFYTELEAHLAWKAKKHELVLLRAKYTPDNPISDVHTIRDVILSKDKYLMLGYWLMRNREDWNDGYGYAEVGLSQFSIDSAEDAEIHASLTDIINRSYEEGGIDGRVFRDCEYSYGYLFGKVNDQSLFKDYEKITSMMGNL